MNSLCHLEASHLGNHICTSAAICVENRDQCFQGNRLNTNPFIDIYIYVGVCSRTIVSCMHVL